MEISRKSTRQEEEEEEREQAVQEDILIAFDSCARLHCTESSAIVDWRYFLQRRTKRYRGGRQRVTLHVILHGICWIVFYHFNEIDEIKECDWGKVLICVTWAGNQVSQCIILYLLQEALSPSLSGLFICEWPLVYCSTLIIVSEMKDHEIVSFLFFSLSFILSAACTVVCSSKLQWLIAVSQYEAREKTRERGRDGKRREEKKSMCASEYVLHASCAYMSPTVRAGFRMCHCNSNEYLMARRRRCSWCYCSLWMNFRAALAASLCLCTRDEHLCVFSLSRLRLFHVHFITSERCFVLPCRSLTHFSHICQSINCHDWRAIQREREE